jgi:hypothetical protein
VRMVPLNHWTETRWRSTSPLASPSTDNAGSFAEIDVLGFQAGTECPASFALVQARRPLRPPGRSTATTPQVPNATEDDWR